jgi:hypothetical protein
MTLLNENMIQAKLLRDLGHTEEFGTKDYAEAE